MRKLILAALAAAALAGCTVTPTRGDAQAEAAFYQFLSTAPMGQGQLFQNTQPAQPNGQDCSVTPVVNAFGETVRYRVDCY